MGRGRVDGYFRVCGEEGDQMPGNPINIKGVTYFLQLLILGVFVAP